MHYVRTLNRNLLARCHRCEWWYVADDSEFPSKFIFDLVYHVSAGDIVLRSIQPHGVVTTDVRGNPLFFHQFTDQERPQVWQWFHARLNRHEDRLLESMHTEIQQDRQSRSAATEQTFLELVGEQQRRE